MSSGASSANLVSSRFGPLAGASPRHRSRPRWHLWSHSPGNGRVESRSRVSPRLAAVLRRRSSRDPAPRSTSALSLARSPPNPLRLRHVKTLNSTSRHPFRVSRVFLETANSTRVTDAAELAKQGRRADTPWRRVRTRQVGRARTGTQRGKAGPRPRLFSSVETLTRVPRSGSRRRRGSRRRCA